MPDDPLRSPLTLMLDAIQSISLIQVELARSQSKLDLLLEDRIKASEHRREIYDEVNDIKLELAALPVLARQVQEHALLLNEINADRQQAKGVVWLGRIIIAAVAGAIGAIVHHLINNGR